MSDTAEAYIRLATQAIRFAQSREELLEWWQAETDNRAANGVIGSYDRRLREACRHHTAILAEKALLPAVEPPPPPRQKRGK